MCPSGSGSYLDPPSRDLFGRAAASAPRRRFPFDTSFENPLQSFAAEHQPDVEHMIVIDRSRGFLRTTAREAREYADMGLAVFHLTGRCVRAGDWDPPLSGRSREHVEAESFQDQLLKTWDLKDQIRAELDAHLNEEIFYDPKSKSFKLRKVTTVKSPKGTKKGGGDKRDPSAGAGAAAAGSTVTV